MSKEKVVEFYEKVIESFGFETSADDVVMIEDKPFKIDGLPLALPTKDNILNATDKDGNLQLYIFNILDESIGRRRKDVDKLYKAMKSHIHIALYSFMYNIVNSLENSDDLDLKKTIIINLVNQKVRGNAKKVVDDKTKRLLEALLVDPEIPLVKLYSRSKHKILGDEYRKVIMITFPFLEHLQEGNLPDGYRRKDKDLFQYLMQLFSDNFDSYLGYSNNGDHPFASAMLSSHLRASDNIMKLIKNYGIDIEYPIPQYSSNDLNSLPKLQRYVALIPNTDNGELEEREDATEFINKDNEAKSRYNSLAKLSEEESGRSIARKSKREIPKEPDELEETYEDLVSQLFAPAPYEDPYYNPYYNEPVRPIRRARVPYYEEPEIHTARIATGRYRLGRN